MSTKHNSLIVSILISIILFTLWSVTYAKNKNTNFTDLEGYEWAEEYIKEFESNKIISGTSPETFSPGNNVKREEFVKVIVNLFSYSTSKAKCDFEDVNEDDWFYKYVGAATKAGIINGMGNNKFGAGELITRQDMCVILYRVLQDKGYAPKEIRNEELSFEDKREISDYAKEAVEKLYKAEVINGTDATHMSPKSYANRAQMVKMTYLSNKNKVKAKNIADDSNSNVGSSGGSGGGSGGNSGGSNESKVSVTGVSLNKASTTLTVGGKETLAVTVSPSNATNKGVTWSSSNSNVVTVSNGAVTAVGAGTATITVKTTDGGKVANCIVTVKVPTPQKVSVTGVSLNKTSMALTVGEKETLIATVSPDNADNKKVMWNSDKIGVAVVSNGTVTAVGAGTATITAKTSDGGKVANCTVTVKAKIVSVTGVNLNKTSTTLTVGGKETLTATVSPSNATNKGVTWSSSNSNVATVSNGAVTAVGAGTATITAKTSDGGKVANCTVTVKAKIVSVTGVSLNKTSTTLTVGGKETLTAIVSPSNATNKGVTWSSSNSNVATVSNGAVTAVGAGTATITAKTSDGGKVANCTITVKAKIVSVTGVSLNKTSTTLTVGGKETLTATVSPSNATNKGVTWSSSNSNVATVSNGAVTAVGAGTATITTKTSDGGKAANCIVTVKAPAPQKVSVTGVSLNKTSMTLTVGGKETLKATVTPGNATNKGVTWSSSKTGVATVSNGTVTAVSAGTATITAKTADGGKSASCTVTVKNKTQRILFIGNSNTYYSNYMKYVVQIAKNQGYTFSGYKNINEIHVGFINSGNATENSYYSYTIGSSTLLQKYNALIYSAKYTKSNYKKKVSDSVTQNAMEKIYKASKNNTDALNSFKKLKIDCVVLQEKRDTNATNYFNGAKNLLRLLYNVDGNEKATTNINMNVYLRDRWGYPNKTMNPNTSVLKEVQTKLNNFIKDVGGKGKVVIISDGEVVRDLCKEFVGYNEKNHTLNKNCYTTLLKDTNGHPTNLTAYICALIANKTILGINVNKVTYIPSDINIKNEVKVYYNNKLTKVKQEVILKRAKELIK